MTRVLCIFKGCIYNRDNECIKDEILLDENVSDIYIGCPDAVWEESEVEAMTREEAIEKLEAFAPMVVDDTREAIDMAIEALQAEPVKHGEWQADKKSVGGMMYIKAMKCSKCNRTFTIRADWNYCPNCGAKMDKD